MPTNITQDLVLQPEVSVMLRLPKSSVHSLSKRGLLPAPIRLSPRRVAWRRDDIESWLAEGGIKPQK